ncbi:MAG: prepilin-type N-terminal cleavage/methylation domain-containing protein [Deltaproteobacteria bacterium]|nr:prepilin-type N-terminal cleavage/methylation domain-containing protein [Deltaproteobacteria bacterium]
MRSKAGFSLLEVMIAIGILAVSLLAIYGLQSTSLLGSARAQKISIATQLARGKMAATLLDLEVGMQKGDFPDDKEESGTFEAEKYPDYTWKVKIRKTELPAPPVPQGGAELLEQVFKTVSEQLSQVTREVRLSVSWKEFDEEEEGIVLTTHIVKM